MIHGWKIFATQLVSFILINRPLKSVRFWTQKRLAFYNTIINRMMLLYLVKKHKAKSRDDYRPDEFEVFPFLFSIT